jgi:hypothetical protein
MLKPILVTGMTVAAAMSFAAPGSAVSSAVKPPAGKITMALINANGSGCPIGTTRVAPFEDNTGFTEVISTRIR